MRPRQTVLIFGGAGFVGTHVARYLVDAGHEVISADLVPPATTVPGVEYRTVDVRTPIALALTSPPELVLNLAAVHRTPGHPADAYYETNVLGAINITRWMTSVGASNLLFTSSISVYGPSEALKTEQSPVEPNSSYGWSKFLAEEVQRDWVQGDAGRHLVCIRPAVIFGTGERGNFTRLAAALRRRRFLYPRTDTIKACGYVDDLVVLVSDLWEQMSAGQQLAPVINFCFPREYDIQDICETFSRVAGYPRPPVAPRGLVHAATTASSALPGELSARVSKLTHSTRISPQVLVEQGFVWAGDLEDALRAWRVDSAGTFT